MKKVLLISYYWPPSGGAGVQRWLKLTKYLSQLGVECHVITVDPDRSSYPNFDYSLSSEVGKEVRVYKTDSFEPTNVYKRIAGKDNVPTAGFANVNNSSLKQKLVNALRSNFFIPDPRIGWNKYAYKKAVEVIKAEGIETVITTSPPHSTQMVGLKLKAKGVCKRWIADLRDPWTDIYYYDLLQHSFLSHAINLRKERKVLEQADILTTVSEGLVEGFMTKTKAITKDKFTILPNGFDPADFDGLEKVKNEAFCITYTGTMSEIYAPEVFLEALSEVQNDSSKPVILKIVGSIAESIQDKIVQLGINADFVGTVPHSEVNQYQVNADLLLLIIPKVKEAKGILTGKIFEYLAASNKVLSIGPVDGDAAAILSKTGVGETFEHDDKQAIIKYLRDEIEVCRSSISTTINIEEVKNYSRVIQATQVSKLVI